METENRTSSGHATALLMGAMLGGALALYYAPKAGSKTRSLLQSTEHKAEEEAQALATHAWKYMDDKAHALVTAALHHHTRKEESQASQKGMGIGLLAGLLVGGIAARLYAPKSGKEIRHLLKVKAENTHNEAVELAEQAKDFAVEEARKVVAAASAAKREAEAKHS